jgi:hypothetical protein
MVTARPIVGSGTGERPSRDSARGRRAEWRPIVLAIRTETAA